MRPVVLTKALAAASANNICTSQSAAGAANLTINGSAAAGGIATLDTQRRVLITSGGNDSGITFTVFGTTQSGNAIQETVTGADVGTVATNQDFLTITQVSTSGATASNVTVGTNTVGSTPWVLADQHVTPGNLSLGGLVVSGSVTYTAEYTYDDFLNLTTGAYATPQTPQIAYPTPRMVVGLTSVNTSTDALLSNPIKGWRLTINSGTGTASLTGTQAGIKQ